MPLVTLKTILDDARIGNYAVPAFDVLDKVSADIIIRTAEQCKKPVILMVPEAGLPFVDMQKFFEYLAETAGNASIPVALELDHGKSYDVIAKAIHYGFTGVMIDGSELPYDENAALTKKIVELAHASGVSVEAEIGHVAGGEGNMIEGSEVDTSMYTDPDEARRFAQDTQTDALAVAFGTVHGRYKGTPHLDTTRLEMIRDLVSVPLVMHGGSGVSDDEFRKAVRSGINKVNIFTEISMAAVENVAVYCKERNNKLHFAELLKEAERTISEIVKHYLELLSATDS